MWASEGARFRCTGQCVGKQAILPVQCPVRGAEPTNRINGDKVNPWYLTGPYESTLATSSGISRGSSVPLWDFGPRAEFWGPLRVEVL